MSELPKGTALARNLLESVAIKGAYLKIVTVLPWVNWWPLSAIIQRCIEVWAVDPALDETTMLAIAVVYVVDRKAFDREFIKAKMLDKQKLSPAELEASLVAQEKAMLAFLKRGPIQ